MGVVITARMVIIRMTNGHWWSKQLPFQEVWLCLIIDIKVRKSRCKILSLNGHDCVLFNVINRVVSGQRLSNMYLSRY